MSEQTQKEVQSITGRLIQFDQVGLDGVVFPSTMKIGNLDVGLEYVRGVDLAQPSGDMYLELEVNVELEFDSVGKLYGYSLISTNYRIRNGKSY